MKIFKTKNRGDALVAILILGAALLTAGYFLYDQLVFSNKMTANQIYKNHLSLHNISIADIVQTIEFGDKEKLIKYCQGIQMGSPVDSNSIPEPWDMPGYTDQVIMAAGAFTQGSSIELSCDAPIRPPFIAFQQGGLTYEYGKIGVMKAISQII